MQAGWHGGTGSRAFPHWTSLRRSTYPAAMTLHLRILDGPQSSHTAHGDIPLSAELVLGRGADCGLRLDSRSVSRRHARLYRDGERWLVEDLNSRYGTTLNGAALEGPSPVAAGDRIVLGRVEIAIEGDDVAPAEPAAPAEHEDRRYRVLLRILDLLGGERSLADILAAVIRLAGETVGADRGFILLHDGESERWRPDTAAAWRAKDLDEAAPPGFDETAIGQVSQTVLGEALASGASVFLKAAAADPRFAGAESLMAQQVQSLLCVPLLASGGGRPLGAFYVDRRLGGGGAFTEADRELLETVAAQAGRVIEKEQLERSRARGEKLALLGTMVGRITHELKNPLYNIRGTAENIQSRLDGEGLSDEELRARLRRIQAGLDKAESRMRSLLRFARPGGGPREPVDLARVLTAAAVETAPRYRELGIELERDYPRGLTVLADADALEQVFSNLLVNAAQALQEGGGRVRVAAASRTRLGEEPDWVEVCVEDSGPGIPAEHLSRVFEDFFTTKSGSGGSGLGLAICRHLVDEHRGELTAENRAEGGARFRVGLPLHIG